MALEKKERNWRKHLGHAQANKLLDDLSTTLKTIENTSYMVTKKDADKLIRAYKLIARVMTHL